MPGVRTGRTNTGSPGQAPDFLIFFILPMPPEAAFLFALGAAVFRPAIYQLVAISSWFGLDAANPPVSQTIPVPSDVGTRLPRG